MNIQDVEIPIGKQKTRTYRFFEIFPGFVSWTIIFMPAILSFINPTAAAYFVVFFMVMWLFKTLTMSGRVFQGHAKLKKYMKYDWQMLLNDLEHQEVVSQQGPEDHDYFVEQMADGTHFRPSQLVNVAMIAVYNESYEIIEPTVRAVVESNYNTKQVILMIAYEARGGEEVKKTVKRLVEQYGEHFMYAVAVEHPDKLPNEVIGKGGNITFAGRELAKYLETNDIEPERVIVTTLDSDNRPHREYFACLSYTYITTPNQQHKSFQPIPMYTNNIWDVPAPMRVLATGNSFFMVIQSVRPHLLRNFSAHAQGMAALIDTDYWSVRTIVEDGHQFWRTYFKYDGNHDVIPIFVPIYQDAVLSDTYRKTMKAQFIQLRRWAWGASDIAYVTTRAFFMPNTIPFGDKLSKWLRLLESHISWATVPFILAFAGFAPRFLSPDGSDSIVAHQLPLIARNLNTVIASGILVSVYLSVNILPPRPVHYSRRRSVYMLVQWVWLPVVSLLYGGFSALYSQTRLMMGWYLGKFDVTEKAVKVVDQQK